MATYNKAITAFVAAAVSLAANFGIELPENVLGLINGAVPLLAAVAVYVVPNK